MTIRISCPGCHKSINAPDSFAGKTGRCPACKQAIAIPKPALPDADDDLFDLADEPRTPASPPPPRPAPANPVSVSPVASPVGEADWQSDFQTLTGPQTPKPASRRAAATIETSPWHSRRYLLFVLALLPLVLMLFRDEEGDDARFRSTLDNNPEVEGKIDSLAKADKSKNKELSKEEKMNLLPDKKIEGALLASDSLAHWGLGLLSAIFFAAVLFALFPQGNARPQHTALVALATATFGVAFLLMLQGISHVSEHFVVRGGGIVGLIILLLQFISFSYSAALDLRNGFLLSFFGYTFGVGLCEEFCKSYPLIFRFGFKPPLDFRGACFWGLASGAGFGVAEGIMYSSNYYNGVATPGIYLVRFIACVALHATWSGSAAIAIYRRREFFVSQWEWSEMAVNLLWVLGVPMTLHGLYDTLLKKDMIGFAVLVAVVSFGWLAFLIETTQGAWRGEVDTARYAH